MFPATAAGLLRDKYGHDAVHVTEVGLRGAPDTQVAATARADSRAVVTENVADFSAERDIVLVFVLKRNLPRPPQPFWTAGTTSTQIRTSARTGRPALLHPGAACRHGPGRSHDRPRPGLPAGPRRADSLSAAHR